MYGEWPESIEDLLETFQHVVEFGDPLPGQNNRFWDEAEERVDEILEEWGGEINPPSGLIVEDCQP